MAEGDKEHVDAEDEEVPDLPVSRPTTVAPVRVSTWVLVIIVIGLLVTAGWYYDTYVHEEDEGPPPVYPNFDGYPRVDGSTSAHPLDMLACCYRMNTQWEWRRHWDDTYRIFPLRTDPQHDEIIEWVDHSGTHGSYIDLIENKADLILVARMPSDSELAWAYQWDVDLEIEAIAYDAFVFIVNNDCSVNSLTTEQIQKIYQGQITNWSRVGGDPWDINPYQRDENSGSQELMMDLVMKDLTIINAPDMILQGMMGPINVISYDEHGLGYSVYFFEEFMAPNDDIQLVTVDGVTPAFETIQSGEYPYSTEVYAVIRSDTPADHPAKKTRDWFLSQEGQNVVEMSGYVPVSAN